MKICPQCGAKTFDDMKTCYGCLYVFPREERNNSAGNMPIKLVLQYQNGALKEETFSQSRVSIGRSRMNDVVLEDPRISREHLVLERDGKGQLWAVDASATNPTLYNGIPLQGRAVVNAEVRLDIQGVIITAA